MTQNLSRFQDTPADFVNGYREKLGNIHEKSEDHTLEDFQVNTLK